MKILYFISLFGNGRGGHYYSLNHISSKISENHEVRIVSIGIEDNNAVVLSNPNFLKHINFYGLNFLHLRIVLLRIFKEFSPDVFHCFDSHSYNLVRLFINTNKDNVIVNKCGGPNPQKTYPYVPNLILFSQENLDWFKNKRKFRDCYISLIPNRVMKIELDYMPLNKEKDQFSFVRICRIDKDNRKTIFDSIILVEQLKKKGFSQVKLYLIGVIRNFDLFSEINNNPLLKDGSLVILTDIKYTKEASKLLYLADAVLGTGRSLMEAASLKKPLLTFDANSNIPVLLTKENFCDAFRTNFSSRNIFKETDRNFNNIERLISDKFYYNEVSTFSQQVFNDFFSLENSKEQYINVYDNSLKENRKIIMDIPLIIFTILKFIRVAYFHKNQKVI